MKKLLVGLTLIMTVSSFASEMPTESEMNEAAARAEFATNLWFCDAEETLKELVDSVNIKNDLGCANAIDKAKLFLPISEVSSILDQHVFKLKSIKAFEADVKSGKGYDQIFQSVKFLKTNGLSLELVKRYTKFTPEEAFVVEYSFEKCKTDLELALENY